MKALEEKIRREGRILPGDVVKVDSFLNHRIDVAFTDRMAEAFYDRFKDKRITQVMTIEASGIAIAAATARYFGVPVLFAKKTSSNNIGDELYHSSVYSYTREHTYEITVSRNYLNEHDTVLLIDDFLAKGNALRGMIDLCEQAGAEVAGIGICVEKGFQGGGDALRREGYDLLSLAVIDRMDEDGKIVFRAENA